MKAIIVGSVESTRVALRVTAAAAGFEVPALVTLPTHLSARHSDFVDLATVANEIGAKVIHAPSSNAPEVISEIRRMKPDLALVIGWSQICKPAFIEAAGGQVVGYHPAPLPQMRGRGAIPWTILLDRTITASTLFWLDDGIDSGPILAQQFLHVARDETATSLYNRHLVALEAILVEGLRTIALGNPPRTRQDERYASWTAKRTPADGLIDWHKPAEEIWRLVRAVTRPYPGAFTNYEGQALIVWGATPSAEASRHFALPGQVILRDGNEFVVHCGDGRSLRINEWQTQSGQAPKLHSMLGRAK